MARKKFIDQGEELKMDLSPMIDMVFLLLIFFIVVSVQSEVQTDPEVEPTIASRSAVQKDTIARIVINIYKSKETGNIVYSREDTSLIEENKLSQYIKDQAKEIKKSRPTTPLTLHMRCDRGIEWQDIQKVKKIAAREGLVNVNFASFQQARAK